MSAKVVWGGYEFTAFDSQDETAWNNLPGVYIFAGHDPTGQWWQAKYIGQTSSFRDRLSGHDRWTDAQRLGASHIHARVVRNAAQRSVIEGNLIRAYSPPLNSYRR